MRLTNIGHNSHRKPPWQFSLKATRWNARSRICSERASCDFLQWRAIGSPMVMTQAVTAKVVLWWVWFDISGSCLQFMLFLRHRLEQLVSEPLGEVRHVSCNAVGLVAQWNGLVSHSSSSKHLKSNARVRLNLKIIWTKSFFGCSISHARILGFSSAMFETRGLYYINTYVCISVYVNTVRTAGIPA